MDGPKWQNLYFELTFRIKDNFTKNIFKKCRCIRPINHNEVTENNLLKFEASEPKFKIPISSRLRGSEFYF